MKKVVVVLALLAVVGVAQANMLTNASFETATLDQYGSLVPDNWGVWSDTWNGSWNQVTDGTAYDGLSQWKLTCGAGVVVGVQGAYATGTGETGTVGFWIRNDGTVDTNIEIGWDYTAPDFSGWWGQAITGFSVPADGQYHYFSQTGALWDNAGVKPKVAVFGGGGISVDAASFVPEPATMLLLGLGGLLLRKKK